MLKINNQITILDDFTLEKAHDIFKEVTFKYGKLTWNGAIPKLVEKQGIEFNDETINSKITEFYDELSPDKKDNWINESEKLWLANKDNQTHKVLKALYSGNWECRVHGPVPKVNPQPSARIKALKVLNYVIASKRRDCAICNQRTMHDILIMFPLERFQSRFKNGNELRTSISDKLKEQIKKQFGKKEACFGVVRSGPELIIDHKFPSQRWSKAESENPDTMTKEQIEKKFQLLSNQSNMWKSRYCDTCVKENTRGSFLGITWFYVGTQKWEGKSKDDESGCIGCPWYDLELWKAKLLNDLKKD